MRIWKCCETTYTHNDTVGCCSARHNVFSGIAAFDAHQVGPREDHGRLRCVDPAAHEHVTKGGETRPAFEVSGKSKAGEKALWALWKSPEQKAKWAEARDMAK